MISYSSHARFGPLLVLVALLVGCGPDAVDVDQAVQNAYEGNGIVIHESADYVYVERSLESMLQHERVDAYQYALETMIEALENSDFTNVPGSQTVLDLMWDINMSATIDQIGTNLDEYETHVEEQWEIAAPPTNLVPSGVLVFMGLPVSASAVVGASGGVTAIIVLKLYKVTRIRKSDGTVDEDWHRWSFDAADGAILKVGVGVGAGGGLGLHGGLGLIWGELESPEDFRGQTGLITSVPIAGGIGPVVQAGVRWSNVTESAEPTNFYVMAGVEGGATAKALETHVQGGNITGLWKWVAAALGFDGVAAGGQLSTDELE